MSDVKPLDPSMSVPGWYLNQSGTLCFCVNFRSLCGQSFSREQTQSSPGEARACAQCETLINQTRPAGSFQSKARHVEEPLAIEPCDPGAPQQYTLSFPQIISLFYEIRKLQLAAAAGKIEPADLSKLGLLHRQIDELFVKLGFPPLE